MFDGTSLSDVPLFVGSPFEFHLWFEARYFVGMLPDVPATIRESCDRYLSLLDHWNRIHALTALPAAARFEELIQDSMAFLPFMESLSAGSRVVDFGSGMGIPGIPLALARPDLDVVILDKSQKKMAFVKQVILELELKNVLVKATRIEALPSLKAAAGVGKAVGSLSLLASWWKHHGLAGGPLYALKGPNWLDEERSLKEWKVIPHPYRLPTRGERVVLELRFGGTTSGS